MILKKEQSVIESIRDTFKGEDIRIQYTVLGYRIDLYFYEHKLAIEIDELGHNDRNTDYETKREREIKNELNCVFIRTNPDVANFNINELNNQLFKHIIQSKEKNAVNKVINKIAEDFKKIVAVTKLKELRQYFKKFLPNYKKWETLSKIKPTKIKKQLGTTYCFGCKDYTQNFRPEEVKMTNKLLREKSHCVVCRSNKSRFLKQKIN